MKQPTAPIKVILVDDSPIARAGISALLGEEPGIEVVGQADGGGAGLALYRQHHPDIVVTDLKMPEIDGVELTRLLVAETPPAKVLVLTHYDGEETVFRALKAGALGYIPKEISGADLIQAVRMVATGAGYMPPEIGAQLAKRAVSRELSPREKTILEHLAEGRTNPEIAAKLAISKKTVAMYVSQILDKLDAHTRTEAVAVAMRRGLLRPER